MANVSVLNMEGQEVGTIDLNDAIFGVEVNENLILVKGAVPGPKKSLVMVRDAVKVAR